MKRYAKKKINHIINRFQRFDLDIHPELFNEFLFERYLARQSDFPELAKFLSAAQIELANCILPLNKSISSEIKLKSILENLRDTLSALSAFDKTIRDEADYRMTFDSSFPRVQIEYVIRILQQYRSSYWEALGPEVRFNERLLKTHPMFSVEPVTDTGSVADSPNRIPDTQRPLPQHSNLSNGTNRLGVLQADTPDNGQDPQVHQQSTKQTWQAGTPDNGQDPQAHQQSTRQAKQAGRKHYTVFVSSTFEDMKDIRAAVLGMLYSTEDFMPIGMENFTASDSSQLDYIRERLNDTDIYVLLLGGRYGTLTPGGDRSYTHEEYEMAKANPDVRVLSFVCDHPENLPGERRWEDDEERDKLRKFTEEVENSMVKLWTVDASPEKIAIDVFQSVVKVKETETLRGWIRG